MSTSRLQQLLVLLALTLVAPGWWGKKKEEPEPPPEDTDVDEAPPVAEPVPAPVVLPEVPRLFSPGALPAADVHQVPDGLANASAQGCNACHYGAHDQWAVSAHGDVTGDEAFLAAVAEVGDPTCTACHLPLLQQRPVEVAPDPTEPATRPNPAYVATLHTEGVTCAACHVRDGLVLAAEPVLEAPHAMGVSPVLAEPAFCASCHQLSWPGADQPLYDTYGEWERSPHAAAGVTCQDCHMGPGAGGVQLGARHDFPADPARAVSVLVDLAPHLVRGGDPLAVEVRLQNTGAGHAFPTGSPWNDVVVRLALVGPDRSEAPRAVHEVVLGRTLEEEPPWRTLADTRLQPAGERVITWAPALDQDAPGGPWFLAVTLTERTLGEAAPAPFFERRIPITVD